MVDAYFKTTSTPTTISAVQFCADVIVLPALCNFPMGHAERLATRVNYCPPFHILAQLRDVFASAQSFRQYRGRRRRGSRKLVTHFNHNACSDAQSSGAALGHSGTRRSTANGYDIDNHLYIQKILADMTFPHNHPLSLSLPRPLLTTYHSFHKGRESLFGRPFCSGWNGSIEDPELILHFRVHLFAGSGAFVGAGMGTLPRYGGHLAGPPPTFLTGSIIGPICSNPGPTPTSMGGGGVLSTLSRQSMMMDGTIPRSLGRGTPENSQFYYGWPAAALSRPQDAISPPLPPSSSSLTTKANQATAAEKSTGRSYCF